MLLELFLGREGNPPSCSEQDDGPEIKDGEREEAGLWNREKLKMVFYTGDTAVGKALNSAPERMATCLSLPADRENLLK